MTRQFRTRNIVAAASLLALLAGAAPSALAQEVPAQGRMAADGPQSGFAADMDRAAYANVRRALTTGQKPAASDVRVAELINYFDYGYTAPSQPGRPFATFTAVAPSPWSPGRQLVQVGIRGYRPAQQPPVNIVFLVDTAMEGEAKLSLAQQAVRNLVWQLREGDKISVIAYGGASGAVIEHKVGEKEDLTPLAAQVAGVTAGGSTADGQGLALAYKMAERNKSANSINRIILMTDGDYALGLPADVRLDQYVAQGSARGVHLSVFGFGPESYRNVQMQTLAEAGHGTATYIDSLNEARRVYDTELAAPVPIVAENIEIEVEFNRDVVRDYRLIGYRTPPSMESSAVAADRMAAGGTVTALYEITPVGVPMDSGALPYDHELTPFYPRDNIATVRVRYEKPGEDRPHVVTRTVAPTNVFRELESAPHATRLAAAVAAYAQLLRGELPASKPFSWADTLELARDVRGEDRLGLEAELVRLIRTARDLQPAGL